jgi:hypothetical protein
MTCCFTYAAGRNWDSNLSRKEKVSTVNHSLRLGLREEKKSPLSLSIFLTRDTHFFIIIKVDNLSVASLSWARKNIIDLFCSGLKEG